MIKHFHFQYFSPLSFGRQADQQVVIPAVLKSCSLAIAEHRVNRKRGAQLHPQPVRSLSGQDQPCQHLPFNRLKRRINIEDKPEVDHIVIPGLLFRSSDKLPLQQGWFAAAVIHSRANNYLSLPHTGTQAQEHR